MVIFYYEINLSATNKRNKPLKLKKTKSQGIYEGWMG